MMQRFFQKNKKENRGYTLLFAVLVSALVLSIAISILNISKKEFLLAASARDSSSAFYAADSGIECAVYAQFKNDAFNLTTNKAPSNGCKFADGPIFETSPYFPNSTSATPFVFHAKLFSDSASCVIVKVEQTIVNGSPQMNIYSSGFNTGWNTGNQKCDLPSAKRVERAIHIKY